MNHILTEKISSSNLSEFIYKFLKGENQFKSLRDEILYKI